MATRKTEYELFPTQFNFLFGYDKEIFKRKGKEFIDVSLYQGGFTCKKGNAEYLSPTGWKRLDTLTKDDLMAVYHRDGSIKFEHPLEVFRWKADTWYEFHTRTLHQVNCPNHKMYTIKDGREHIQPMSEFYKEHIASKYGHRGKFVTTFIQDGTKTGLTEKKLRVLIAYQADGYDYATSDWNVAFHFCKERKYKRLLELLESVGFNYKIGSLKSGDFRVYAKIDESLKLKVFPKEWYQLDSSELKIIIDECAHWDGSIGKHNSYYTSAKENADFIQFAGSASGYRTTIFTRTRPSASGSGKPVTEYRVNFNTNTMPSLYAVRNKPEIKVYNAKENEIKYCPSTSTGLWLCREFNKITITGNSGKTFCGSLRGLLFAFQFPGCTGLVGAATQDLLDNTTKAKYEWHLDNMGMQEGVHWFWSDRKTKITLLNGSTIRFKTVSNWENFRSTEFTWIELEEASLIDEKTFKELMARLREPAKYEWESPYKCMFLHTNPQGSRGWIYKLFHNKKTKKQNYRAVIAATTENTYLGTEYVETLKDLYSADEINELILGRDNELDNTVAFPYFSMDDNVIEKAVYNPRYPLILTCDFNYKPMCWYLVQKQGDSWVVLRELIAENVTTKQMCSLILPALGEYPTRNLLIMGDSHGRDKKTNGSDYSVMLSSLGERGYNCQLRVQKANPRINERLSILRGYICNAKGIRKLFIDKSCKWFIYNLMEAKNNLASGGLKIPTDKEIQSDPDLLYMIHPIDAVSYPIYYAQRIVDMGGEFNRM